MAQLPILHRRAERKDLWQQHSFRDFQPCNQATSDAYFEGGVSTYLWVFLWISIQDRKPKQRLLYSSVWVVFHSNHFWGMWFKIWGSWSVLKVPHYTKMRPMFHNEMLSIVSVLLLHRLALHVLPFSLWAVPAEIRGPACWMEVRHLFFSPPLNAFTHHEWV